ncbi:MAG TPA: DUF4019 domain-containing protein, partial [Pirellulaceae bacterium]|nr:DUF4019 domain-containing protein [Pirellulaceae bacterium]
VIVTARWNTEGRGTLGSFNPPAEPITQDGVEVADGGWKITAAETRTVRLFEAPLPPLAAGPFFYRAKLKTENVKDRAFLEMWVRFPGEGEFFSKGFHNAVSGTNGWAEYEIPFFLKKGQQPDLAKLNLTIEGSGTVWIKDIQLRGRQTATPVEPASVPGGTEQPADSGRLKGKWVPVSASFLGKPLTDEQLARMAITLEGDRAELVDPDSGQSWAGTFTVNADRMPKHITFLAPDSKEQVPGIFEFDGQRLKLAWIDGDYARPTDFSPNDQPDHMTGVFERAPLTGSPLGPTEREALKAAEAYLAVIDEGRFGQLRDMVSSLAKQHVTREQVSQTYQKLRDTFGKATHRTLNRVQVYDEFPGLPAGRYAGVQYKTDFERQKELWESLLLNVDTDGQWRVNTYANTLEPMPFPETKKDPVIEQKLQAATSAAQDWLKLVDAGNYGESWEASAKINRDGIGKEKMIDAYKELFQPLGAIKSRTFKSSEYTTQMPQAPVGEYAVIQFNTQFVNQRIIETVVLTKEPDGHWRVAGYRHAEDNSPPTPPPATSKPPQRKTGLLTNPPKLPPEGVPVGRNLIVDPSLEETPTGGLPNGWFAWLDDGPDFKCEVFDDLEVIAYDRDKLPENFDAKHGRNNQPDEVKN